MVKRTFRKWLKDGLKRFHSWAKDHLLIDLAVVGWVLAWFASLVIMIASIPFGVVYNPLWFIGFPSGLLSFLYLTYFANERD